MGGRAVEGTGLENRQRGNPFVGSNPTPSASRHAAPQPPLPTSAPCRRPAQHRTAAFKVPSWPRGRVRFPPPPGIPAMVLLINLESAQLRRAAMTKRLAEQRLRHARVGVDMRHLSRDEVTARCASAFPTLAFDLGVLSCAEVGCWASHLIAWRRLVEQSAKRFCTVLEDDVVLRPAFAAAIATLSQHSHPFDVVYLGTSSRNLSSRRRTLVGSCAVHEPVGNRLQHVGLRDLACLDRALLRAAVGRHPPADRPFPGRARARAEAPGRRPPYPLWSPRIRRSRGRPRSSRTRSVWIAPGSSSTRGAGCSVAAWATSTTASTAGSSVVPSLLDARRTADTGWRRWRATVRRADRSKASAGRGRNRPR